MALGLAVSVVLVYSPGFEYPPIKYDDPVYAIENPHVQGGPTFANLIWAFTSFDQSNWHPLTWLSLQLDSVIWGGAKSPGGYHKTNVFLHAANTALLFLVLASMTGFLWPSVMVAALFGLHPLHVESVAWITERKDVLSTLFWILAMGAYARYARRHTPWNYALVALMLALGLMAKPMLVTLPCVLLLLDYWPLCRWSSEAGPSHAKRKAAAPLFAPATGSWLLIEKVPLLAIAASSCTITFLAQTQGRAVATLERYPLDNRICNALITYVEYLARMFWPWNLAIYYPHPGAGVSTVWAVAAGAILITITLAAVVMRQRWPYFIVGWLWYVGTLVPVIGLVQVGGQAMADRYTYVPLIGIFILLTWAACDLASAYHIGRFPITAASAFILCACAGLTVRQLDFWSSDLALWNHALTVTRANATALNYRGTALRDQSNREADGAARQKLRDQAFSDYQKIVEIEPQLALGHSNLANMLLERKEWARAAAEYRLALKLDPTSVRAHLGLGSLLDELGWYDEAQVEFQRALELEPTNGLCSLNLGLVLKTLGNLNDAAPALADALRLNPRLFDAYGILAQVQIGLGLYGEAEKTIQNGRDIVVAEDVRAGQPAAQNARLARLQVELERCRYFQNLDRKLTNLSKGSSQHPQPAELLELGWLCGLPRHSLYAQAARFYAEAFKANPALKGESGNRFCYMAAKAAVQAAAGEGKDLGELSDAQRIDLRHQALDWLKEDLVIWTTLSKSETIEDRLRVARALRMEKRSPALASVRDAEALAKLPAGEREAWQQFWNSLDAAFGAVSSPQPP